MFRKSLCINESFNGTMWLVQRCFHFILAAQEGHKVFGQAAAKDPEEEGGVRWRQSQEEGKQLLCCVKVRLCVRAFN